MAKGDHSDLYMIFKDANDNLIDGESTADLTSADQVSKSLLKDFGQPRKVFEIDKFTMSAEADDLSKDEIRAEVVKENKRQTQPVNGAKPQDNMSPKERENKTVEDRLKKQNGNPVKEISFSRTVDGSSAFFLGNIAVGQGYNSAALIKRKATGGKSASQAALVGDVYFRIDFTYVLITEVEWTNDDEEVTEDCKFICKNINIQYRPQLPDGTLGAVISGKFEYPPPKQ